jgi:hypothetical protein
LLHRISSFNQPKASTSLLGGPSDSPVLMEGLRNQRKLYSVDQQAKALSFDQPIPFE